MYLPFFYDVGISESVGYAISIIPGDYDPDLVHFHLV